MDRRNRSAVLTGSSRGIGKAIVVEADAAK